MPIYEFDCKQCFRTFETIAKYDEVVECPECHSLNVKRVVGFISQYVITGDNSSSTQGRLHKKYEMGDK